MNTRTYCVYNQTRECFLSLSVTPADTTFSRLKGLIGRLKLKVDEGLWIVVVMVDIVADGGDQLFQVLEDAAADLVRSEIAEEAFDHVEP